MAIKVTIPLKNGSKIEIDGNLTEVKESLKHMDEMFDLMKTAIGEHQPVTIHQEIPQATLHSDGQIPTLNASGTFASKLEELMRTWAKHPKTLSDVEEVLKTNGEYRSKATVASALLDMVKKGKLRRIRDNEKGNWQYVTAA